MKNQEDQKVLHMWEPLKFQVKEGYNYLRNSLINRFTHGFLRSFAQIVLNIYNRIFLGMKIHGRKHIKDLHGQGAVTICNHVHVMDCTFIDCAYPNRRMYYITLESNFRIPLIRHIIRVLGGVPLSPKPHFIKELFTEMGKAMEQGSFVQVYPESILHPYYDGIRPFKNGAFNLAVMNQTPILPAVITYHKPTGLKRLYKRKPCLHLTILPPIYPDKTANKHEEIRRLNALCFETMTEAYHQISEVSKL